MVCIIGNSLLNLRCDRSCQHIDLPSRIKKRCPKWDTFLVQMTELTQDLAIDGRRFHSRQVKREVVRVTLMHHFHPQVGTVDDVRPGIDDTTLRIHN
jgi:hypothetical protein